MLTLNKKLVFGLLNLSSQIGDSMLAAKLRNFTLSWSRYGYPGRIIENSDLNALLQTAAGEGYAYCLVQSTGHLIGENWRQNSDDAPDFYSTIDRCLETGGFGITGAGIRHSEKQTLLNADCLLVNLQAWTAAGAPRIEVTGRETVSLPAFSGLDFPVTPFPPEFESCKLNLLAGSNTQLTNFKSFLDRALFHEKPAESGKDLSDAQRFFLAKMHKEVGLATNGVFIWNIEPYGDVAAAPPGFEAPLSALYCVGAGFKPNMILHTHGFDENTRLVYFDYSPKALEIKREMHREWDGSDYPRFLKHLFQKFPYPEYYFILWGGIRPDEVDWKDMDAQWEREMETWGGEAVFKNHWEKYRTLQPEYLTCNILTEQEKLLEAIDPGKNAAIWWSNAFFTLYSNWFYTFGERKKMYDGWVRKLKETNPDLYLYGSDYCNAGINFVTAAAYDERYFGAHADYLNPLAVRKHAIRY